MVIPEIYKLYIENFIVDTDTRNIRKNTLFFALKGDKFNGNKFAEEALKKGAKYSIIDEKEYQTNDSIILVDDVLNCLQELASYHRKVLNIPILAITGSNGKTTSKELINSVLSTKFKTIATKGNLNNHIGVPLTLLSMTDTTEFGIVEMGANHLEEINFLCNITNPNFGYITNFGKAHLEGFGSLDGVIKGKSELYNHLKNSNGKVFINPNDELQIKQSDGIFSIPFEKSIAFIKANPMVKMYYQNIEINSQLIGEYNYTNIAAAISIGNYFDINAFTIKVAIENYTSTNNRSQVIKKNEVKIILDAYNANPSSMEIAIENFDQLKSKGSKIAVLGDMFEVGETAEKEHQFIVDLIENSTIDSIYLVGKLFNTSNCKRAKQYNSFNDFSKNMNIERFKGSTLLIKGSRGMALERIVDLF